MICLLLISEKNFSIIDLELCDKTTKMISYSKDFIFEEMKITLLPIVYLIGICLSFTAYTSCQPGSAETLPPPNIVWIASEDNSAHYLQLFDENGVSTPHIESLAEKGITFTRAFSNGAVCSVARSTLVTGCYAPRVGAQFHRKIQQVPMPSDLRMFPAYLREVGYYAANLRKEDYNLIKSEDVWDESSTEATWKNRADGQPFFYMHNIGISHESSLHFTAAEMDSVIPATAENTFEVHPYHPDTEIFRYTNAYYRDRIQDMDRQVGALVSELEDEGLLENTFIFYFGDHGGVLPGSKGYIYEIGVHVPLVVYVPERYQQLVNLELGSKTDGFVSFVDFAPTVLELAGLSLPEEYDGEPFLGKEVSEEALESRDEAFSHADRFDEKYDMVRALRVGNYKYIRNYQPFNFDGLFNQYRYRQLAYQEWQKLYEKGELNAVQSRFFETRSIEMLFDLSQDPYETRNLASDPQYQDQVEEMHGRLNEYLRGMPDLSFYPEHVLIEDAFGDPVAFGQAHQEDISRYIDIADLSLRPFSEVKAPLEEALNSSDPWDRYWALTVCSIFEDKAAEFIPLIEKIIDSDPEPVNRFRAAEFLVFTQGISPTSVMLESLYASDQAAEALLILNSITLMESKPYAYDFSIDPGKLSEAIRENDEVLRRLRELVPGME